MKKFYTIAIFVLGIHLMMSTDCSGFHEEQIEVNPSLIKISLNNDKIYNVGDTITIRGRVSTNGYHVIKMDSVKLEYTPPFVISASKLTKASTSYNLLYAEKKFKIIAEGYAPDDHGNCQNTFINTSAKEDPAKKLYRYEIKMIPKETGDFVLHFDHTFSVETINKKQNLLDSYPITGPNRMRWEFCGNTNAMANLRDGDVFVQVN